LTAHPSLRGSVAEFDDASGLGTIISDDGTAFPFQCTEIADGTRTIVVGTTVTFEVLPKLGRWEAARITAQ
jgi:cold shock CspA family protein